MKMLNIEEALKKSDEYHAVEINKLREVIDALMEKIKKLEAENARYLEALFYISEPSWKDYPRLSDALDGDDLALHFSEIATEAFKEME